ncbi:HEXXH motif-containing putative peptide modification protein [Herbaspirillum sp. YR522]|uniref:aKG-HExxH-type peptide beta-hydroxylase n=1 Tax=Herbaspirillum sp. YR522 TaxID=1144342 RepID=UPI00026F64CB|nr:HEXXH motif-containing putative peptide modification protein [Herbaspirillum sp. YR522]EJN09334.1 hypothetical protein PMI40_00781 [Herbaspirillum sp. YR522]
MILQTSHLDLMNTVLTLVEASQPDAGRNCRSLEQVRAGYRSFLQSLKQRQVDIASREISFITEHGATATLRHYFANDSLLDDRQQAEVIGHAQDHRTAQKLARLDCALHEVSLYSRDYLDFLQTIITDIFILPSDKARAGSTSQAIGLIWMNPRPTYTLPDIIEMLVHEFTHHAMFLDEMKYRHYSYERVLDRSTWARSAILNIARPLDKVLHSIVVSTEILLFRNSFLGHPMAPRVHPPTNKLALQLKTSLVQAEQSVRAHPDVLSERGRYVLANAHRIFHSAIGPLLMSRRQPFMPPMRPPAQAVT